LLEAFLLQTPSRKTMTLLHSVSRHSVSLRRIILRTFFLHSIALTLLLCTAQAHAEIAVVDDAGVSVKLPRHAQRIISLAPHATENLFAAGAGHLLVGAVEYSNYPPAAQNLPIVGNHIRPDLEAIVALKPDLVVAWQSGNADGMLKKLRSLGLKVYQTQPEHLDDIPANIEKLGQLAGTTTVARQSATVFRQRLRGLRKTFSARPPVKVFYQAWHQPLMTIGGSQIINEVIQLCGGRNVFANLSTKAPNVSREAVIAADPEAIIASGMGNAPPIGLTDWHTWQTVRAVQRNNLFAVPADLMQRPTPRLLEGTEQLCQRLETARSRRK
jgi:iron complex transport system substrate-binding protein